MRGNPITATVALAIAGTLAACAAEPSPSMASQPASTSVSEPAAVDVQADPAPTVVQTPAAAGATTAVAREQAEPVRGPPIPAAQLRRQILDLIGSFQTLQDLERAHVEEITRMPMTKIDGMRDGYYYTGMTTEAWSYRVEVVRLGPLSEPPTIIVGLSNGVEPWTDQKPTYCTLDFEDIAKELVALGYEQGQRPRRMGGKVTWGFGKDMPEEKSGIGIGIQIYERDNSDGSSQVCVRAFDIGGSLIDE